MLVSRTVAILVVAAVAVVLLPAVAAQGPLHVAAHLASFNEVPAVVTPGHGTFRAEITQDGIDYKLVHDGTAGTVMQAHIHVGQAGVNGGVAAFLCTDLGNGPQGTPECPPPGEALEGHVRADQVAGPMEQGVAGFEDLVRAIRSGVAYVNVHTDRFPSGEIRGQIRAPGSGLRPQLRPTGR